MSTLRVRHQLQTMCIMSLPSLFGRDPETVTPAEMKKVIWGLHEIWQDRVDYHDIKTKKAAYLSKDCLGAAPSMHSVSSVLDIILMTSTLLLGFNARLYCTYGKDDWIAMQQEFSSLCDEGINATVATAMQVEGFCFEAPIWGKKITRVYWMFLSFFASIIIGLFLKLSVAFVGMDSDFLKGEAWKVWWYINMWFLAVVVVLTASGVSHFVFLYWCRLGLLRSHFRTLTVPCLRTRKDIFGSTWSQGYYLTIGTAAVLAVVCLLLLPTLNFHWYFEQIFAALTLYMRKQTQLREYPAILVLVL